MTARWLVCSSSGGGLGLARPKTNSYAMPLVQLDGIETRLVTTIRNKTVVILISEQWPIQLVALIWAGRA
jgi:hypothetical protein